MRSSRDRRLMSLDGGENGRSINNNNTHFNNTATSSSRQGSGNFVTRSWARISGRRKKQRPPPIEEGVEPLEEPLPSTSSNQQIPWKLANHEDKPKPFLNRGMDKLRRSIRKSFRKAPSLDSAVAATSSNGGILEDGHPTSASPWEADGKNVRAGICKFNVKYLGSCEVYESRGVHVCEGALQHLKSRKRPTKAILYISGDGLRVVDRESNRGLIVDQTIEKVSFCAPDRHCDKGFAYICREGASRRWMCHGFLTTKESGERVSHAVGCAFTICLEAKKKREAEQAAASGTAPQTTTTAATGAASAVAIKTQPTSKYSDLNAVWNTPPSSTNSTSTTPNPGSFAQNNPAYASFRRQLSITERKQDPQTAIVNDPVPSGSVSSKAIINESTVKPRPVANPSLFDRQGSFRAPTVSQQAFKRFNSLRSDLLSRPNLDSTRLLNTEPIYEGDEFWPESALSSNSVVNTLPVSTSLQFNHIAEGNKENGSESPSWNGIFNPTCQSTPTHSILQPPPTQVAPPGPSKADEWLEQTFKSLSFQADSSTPSLPQSQSVDFLAPTSFLSAHPPSQPAPPPLPVTRPVCEPTPNPVISAPVNPASESTDATDSLNVHARKGSSARKSIEYQLLEEETVPVSPPRNTPIAVDAFGLPVFVPPPPPVTATTTTTTAPVMTTRNGPSLSDPFDIQWSTAVLKSTSANIHQSTVSNPFTSESEAVNV